MFHTCFFYLRAEVRAGDEFRESLSHAELWALAGRLAQQLEKATEKAASVAILLERGVSMAGAPGMAPTMCCLDVAQKMGSFNGFRCFWKILEH